MTSLNRHLPRCSLGNFFFTNSSGNVFIVRNKITLVTILDFVSIYWIQGKLKKFHPSRNLMTTSFPSYSQKIVVFFRNLPNQTREFFHEINGLWLYGRTHDSSCFVKSSKIFTKWKRLQTIFNVSVKCLNW